MRDIKFRAWDGEEMWTGFHILPEDIIVPPAYRKTVGRKLEFMQYTGLKDSASVEIYEGDIVCCMGGYEDGESELPGDVQFIDGRWFVITPADSIPLYEYDINVVIGNIYEPELLDGYQEKPDAFDESNDPRDYGGLK